MEIRLLDESDADAYSDLRLRVLREHPEAFVPSHEEEAHKRLSWTEDRLKARDVAPERCRGNVSPAPSKYRGSSRST